jgi:RNA polymerase sigma factor (sigma-70 family)
MAIGATLSDHVREESTYARQEPTPTVAELLIGIREGDPFAWAEIVRRYSKLVSTVVGSFRLQPADVLDARQMTWLRLTENCDRVQYPERLGAWLVTTARRECLQILRQARRTAGTAEIQVDEVIDATLGPEQRVIATELAQEVRNLVAELPPRRRTLLWELFADIPRRYADIARSAQLPIGSIGPTRARTLRMLRQTLEEHGLGRETWW